MLFQANFQIMLDTGLLKPWTLMSKTVRGIGLCCCILVPISGFGCDGKPFCFPESPKIEYKYTATHWQKTAFLWSNKCELCHSA